MKANKEYRLNQNPKEKEFYDKFLAKFERSVQFEQIVLNCDTHGNPPRFLTHEERRLVVSTIQWLGSPVGQSFLMECGFYPVEQK